ncbi:MAG: LysR substrate-binding domain-containing protein [Lautropia sp.]
MDTLLSLQVFRHVAEAGSFTAAAARAGISLAMASKHVAHLERELRARLLNRSSRHVSLTEAGALYYARCRDALDTLDGAAAQLSEGLGRPHGLLRITAPVWFATARIAALLAQFRARHPEVTLELALTNERVDLAAGGFDLALRGTNEPSPSLIVRPICPVRFHSVASPALLARWWAARPGAAGPAPGASPAAAPRPNVSDLAGIPAILPSYLPSFTELPLTGLGGATVAVRVQPVLRSDDTNLSWHAAHAGIGAAFLPEWLVDDDLASGRLQPLLPAHGPIAITLHATYSSRMYLTPKVRAFIDFAIEQLQYHRTDAAAPPGGTR